MTETKTLRDAVVVGFFSLPSPSLAEHNPSAYNAAMAEAPKGAGSCSHCGTGILHHVVIRHADGSTAFIGTSCAEKVGSERVQRCVRERVTDEQLAERERKAAERRAESEALIARVAANRAARYELFKDIIDPLRARGTDFHSSLADQLLDGPLSWRQAEYAAKAVVGRCTKKTETQWEAVYDRCQARHNSETTEPLQ